MSGEGARSASHLQPRPVAVRALRRVLDDQRPARTDERLQCAPAIQSMHCVRLARIPAIQRASKIMVGMVLDGGSFQVSIVCARVAIVKAGGLPWVSLAGSLLVGVEVVESSVDLLALLTGLLPGPGELPRVRPAMATPVKQTEPDGRTAGSCGRGCGNVGCDPVSGTQLIDAKSLRAGSSVGRATD